MAKSSMRTDKTVERLKEERLPIGERCSTIIKEEGKDDVNHTCSRADGEFCGVYAFPKLKWGKDRDCPMADNELRTVVETETVKGKVRVGQQKQKKKSRR